jgi:hypothetical protein
MKQPDDLAIGVARKTLPTRKARKVQRSVKAAALKKPARKRNILDRDVEQELVKVFGEK